MNPTKLSLHQLDFCSSRYLSWNSEGQHWQIARFDFEGCDFHALPILFSANYLQFTPFWIFHPKVPSKHKTKNIKAFYI